MSGDKNFAPDDEQKGLFDDKDNKECAPTIEQSEDKKGIRKQKRLARKKKASEFLKKCLAAFKDALYPMNCTCDVCGEELVADTRYRLCSECVEKLPFVGEHRCLSCGMPLKDESDYCNRCQYEKFAFVKNRSPLTYEGETKKMIYALKFGRKKYIAQTLGALMADEFLKSGMQADIIVFVPMTQKELHGKERAINLEGAFSCAFEQVKNRRLLLIDDIFTTGATANECAKVLLKAGAREVNVLTSAVTTLKIPMEEGKRVSAN